MKTGLLVLGGLALAYMASATYFAAPPRAIERTVPVTNASTERGQDPWAEKERYANGGRINLRESVIEALGQPWSSFCTEKGHADLLASLSSYYGLRDQELQVYTRLWGEPGARHSIQAWSTSDDKRIERLTQEAYHNGYFQPDEVASFARRPVAALLKDERSVGKPCSG